MPDDSRTYEIQTHRYRVKDICLNVAEVGCGEPLVLIHGWTSSWLGWTLLARELAPYYKLYMVDLPGFGDSDPLPAYSVEILRDYMVEFIDRYVGCPRAIVGASSGSFIALDVALTGEYDADLILIGTVLQQERDSFLRWVFSRTIALSARLSPAQQVIQTVVRHPYTGYIIERFYNAYRFDKSVMDTYNIPGRRKTRGKAYVQIGVDLFGSFVNDRLEIIGQPTALIFGVADRLASAAVDFLERTNNPCIELHFVPEAGHGPPHEQPAATAAIIRRYLESRRESMSSAAD